MDNGQLRNPFGMILKRQNMSENKWNHVKIVPQGHNNCQLSTVNCQFGEAAKSQSVFSNPWAGYWISSPARKTRLVL